MMCFRRGSFFNKFSGTIAASFVLSALAFGQHPVAPVVHPPVAPVHVSPPPMYHPPIMNMPITRPPVMYSPIYTPRTGVVRAPGTSGTSIVLPPLRPVRPIRPPIVFVYSPQFFFGDPFWRFNSCWSTNCEFFWPWTLGYTSVSTPGPINYVPQPTETPIYVYGGEREDFPQLFLKNGTILNVTDYWVVEGQLHFKLIEEPGRKPVEQAIPFDDLDLQKTVDANSARGFRFVLRNAPYEEYAREHSEAPPALPPSHE